MAEIKSLTVSVTEIMSYKRCRRQWHLSSSNRSRISRIVPSATFNLGTCIHETFKKWLPNPDAEPALLYVAVSQEQLDLVKKNYHAKNRVNIGEHELQPMYENVKFGARMIDNYKQYWLSPLQDNCVLVAQPEQAIKVPIPGTPHFLKGKLDAIIKNEHGRLLVLEHKTYDKRAKKEVLQTVEQFIAYIWMLTQLEIGPVVGLAYDGLWKRSEIPKGKTVDDLFWREKISPPQSVITEYGEQLAAVVTEMASDPYIYHVRTWNGSCFYGCSHEAICSAMSRDEDVDYLVNTSDIFMVRPPNVDELEADVAERDLVNA